MSKQKSKADPAQPVSGIKGFLKRHRHAFIFFVSLLLLLSLFIREQIRDKAKEKLDGLQAARNMFYLRMDTLRFADEIIEHIEPAKETSPETVLKPGELETKLKEQLKIDFRANMASNHMGDTLSSLAKVVEVSGPENDSVQNIYKMNHERAARFEVLATSLEKHTVTEQDLRTAKTIASDASALDWQILDLGTILADKADREIGRQEAKYKRASLASYFLGVLLLSLYYLGKQYDEELPEADL
jgi:hypothetical protein